MSKPAFHNSYERFFFFYGRTTDEFCSGDLVFRRLDELLHCQLRSLGYERIVLYNAKYKVHAYDPTSFDLMHGSARREVSRSRQKTSMAAIPLGPAKRRLGLRVQRGHEEEGAGVAERRTHSGRYSFGSMNDLDAVSKLDPFMLDGGTKTAIIFTDGMDFINNFEQRARRQMAANLGNWLQLGHNNKNICIFLIPDLSQSVLATTLERNKEWQFLRSKLFSTSGKLSHCAFAVPCPHVDEIENSLHAYRLREGWSVDWSRFHEYLPLIAANVRAKRVSLKEFAATLSRYSGLDIASLRKLAGTDENHESASDKLRSMRGLETLHEKVDDLIHQMKELRGRSPTRDTGSSENPFLLTRTAVTSKSVTKINLHLALKGAPGTGKTTVARLLGDIYRENGLLPSGHLVKASRSDLVAGYVGHTAIQTARLIREAMGGILFVDEAYSLVGKSGNDFGQEALETILEAMENHKGEFAVVFAGYPDEIDQLIASNPGFQSRFSTHNIIEIPSFDSQTLYRILEDTVADNNQVLDDDLSQVLPDVIKRWHAANAHDKAFGNARSVKEDVYEGLNSQRRARVRRDKPTQDNVFVLEDIPAFMSGFVSGETAQSFEETRAVLNSMIGLEEVKSQIDKLIDCIEVDRAKEAMGLPVNREQSFHMLFLGNPGTGKTTVARLFGRLLYGLNVLPSDRVVEVTPKDLVGSHVGEGIDLAESKIQEALGGILFIDEIYGLSQGSLGESYGTDVISTVLVPAMSNYEGELVVIGAGYPGDVEQFLSANKGLDRRFTRKIHFKDFSTEELCTILRRRAQDEGYALGDDVIARLKVLFDETKASKRNNFGNAGTAELCLQLMRENQASRISKLDLETVSKETLTVISVADIPAEL